MLGKFSFCRTFELVRSCSCSVLPKARGDSAARPSSSSESFNAEEELLGLEKRLGCKLLSAFAEVRNISEI